MAPSTNAVLDLASLSLGDAPAVFLDLLALPRSLALDIFARVPVDTRLRCIEVNRAWRALVEDTSLWTCLSLPEDVITVNVSLFRAAVAKAGGLLRCLDVTGRWDTTARRDPAVSFAVLQAVVVANATTLARLRLSYSLIHIKELRELCRSAPNLTLFESDVSCSSDEVNTLLLKQEPFSNLQLTQLCVNAALTDDGSVSSFAKQLVAHGHTLTELILCDAPLHTAAAMGAIVESSVSLRLSKLLLVGCGASPVTLLALTRLVAAGWLHNLGIINRDILLFDEGMDTTRIFCDAVRRASSLRLCDLRGAGRVHELEELAAAVTGVNLQA